MKVDEVDHCTGKLYDLGQLAYRKSGMGRVIGFIWWLDIGMEFSRALGEESKKLEYVRLFWEIILEHYSRTFAFPVPY